MAAGSLGEIYLIPGGLDFGMVGQTEANSIRDFLSSRWRRAKQEYFAYIPRGNSIAEETWDGRHRIILILLWAHVPFLFLLGIFDGHDPYFTGATYHAEPLTHVLAGVGSIAMLTILAGWSRLDRRVRAILASVGLMTCSAVLTHFWGGFIEGHFHFFVMVGVIAAYQDWLPFVASIFYVALHHGVGGTIAPEEVYNHTPAIENPWAWSFIHAVFILALSVAIVSHWLAIERSREETEQQMQQVAESDQQIQRLEKKQAELEKAKKETEKAKAEAERRQQEVEDLNEKLLVRANDVAAAMGAVSHGDFTADPPTDADIEAIEEISDAFETMTEELSGTITDLRSFATTVERTTQSVRGDAATFEATQKQLADDVREFATDLRDQAAQLESITGELGHLSATIEEIAANTEQVSTEASNAAGAASSGTETASEAVAAIEEIEESIETLADLVKSLDSRMNAVDESTTLIDGIAEQTNMLALNANIEAARAGDDGDGFAVVASEVKTLADETQNHSAAIEQTIAETIEDVNRVKAEMGRIKTQIQTGEATITGAGDAFAEVADIVETVDNSINEVAAATDDGARTTEEVADAVTRLADRSRTVAEQSESLADRAEASATTIAEIRSQLDDLASQTATLQEQLATFECVGVENDQSDGNTLIGQQ